MSCYVRLPSTGESVDVATPEGANAFLEQPSGSDAFNFFSADLKTANSIRKREKKKGKLNNSDRQTLRDIYRKVLYVATVGEPKLFREKVPTSELEAWLNHTVEILKERTNDHKWTNTGNLLQHDSFLMSSLVGLFVHPYAVQLVFDKIQVLETIAAMNSTLEKPPTVQFANNVIAIVEYVYQCCRNEFEKKWKAEKAFKKLESTGILQHYLRCAAIEGTMLATKMSPTFNELLTCSAYVQKSFKAGTPCGDTVREILKGADGESRILPYMNSLIQLSGAPAGLSDMYDQSAVCHYCHKRGAEEDLKCCAKCTQAVYCSRECQLADWKAHKKICSAPVSSRNEKNASASQHIVTQFVFTGYVNIMLKMVEECDKAGGLKINDMVAELDVEPDANGVIPLAKDPPEFHIVPVTRYLDGARFKDSNTIFSRKSFSTEARRKEHDENFLAALKYQQSRRKPTELLCVVSQSRTYAFQSIKRYEDESQTHLFSQDAVEAFRSLMKDSDDKLLWEIFTSSMARQAIIYQLAVYFKQGHTNFLRRRDADPIEDQDVDPEPTPKPAPKPTPALKSS